MANPNTYQGDQEPDILSEPVLYSDSKDNAFRMGVLGFYLSFLLLEIFTAAAPMLLKLALPPNAFFLAMGGAVLIGIFVLFLNRNKAYGLAAEVDKAGIKVTKDGIVIQRCGWGEVKVERRRFGQLRLVDQQGAPFPFELLSSKNPDRIFVRQIIRTKLKRLAPSPQPLEKRGYIAIAVATLIGVLGLSLVHRTQTNLSEVVAIPESTVAERLAAFLPVLLSGMLSVGIFAPYILLALAEQKGKERFAQNSKGVQQFVDLKRGKLVNVDLVEATWFRYPEGVGPQAEAPTRSAFILLTVIICVFLAMAGAAWASSTAQETDSRNSAVAMVLLFCLLLASLNVFLFVVMKQRLRAMTLKIRKMQGSYELQTPDGRVIQCTAKPFPKQTKSQSTTFGAVSWVFKGEDGKIYRFDPRFLVIAAVSEKERSGAPLAP